MPVLSQEAITKLVATIEALQVKVANSIARLDDFSNESKRVENVNPTKQLEDQLEILSQSQKAKKLEREFKAIQLTLLDPKVTPEQIIQLTEDCFRADRELKEILAALEKIEKDNKLEQGVPQAGPSPALPTEAKGAQNDQPVKKEAQEPILEPANSMLTANEYLSGEISNESISEKEFTTENQAASEEIYRVDSIDMPKIPSESKSASSTLRTPATQNPETPPDLTVPKETRSTQPAGPSTEAQPTVNGNPTIGSTELPTESGFQQPTIPSPAKADAQSTLSEDTSVTAVTEQSPSSALQNAADAVEPPVHIMNPMPEISIGSEPQIALVENNFQGTNIYPIYSAALTAMVNIKDQLQSEHAAIRGPAESAQTAAQQILRAAQSYAQTYLVQPQINSPDPDNLRAIKEQFEALATYLQVSLIEMENPSRNNTQQYSPSRILTAARTDAEAATIYADLTSQPSATPEKIEAANLLSKASSALYGAAQQLVNNSNNAELLATFTAAQDNYETLKQKFNSVIASESSPSYSRGGEATQTIRIHPASPSLQPQIIVPPLAASTSEPKATGPIYEAPKPGTPPSPRAGSVIPPLTQPKVETSASGNYWDTPSSVPPRSPRGEPQPLANRANPASSTIPEVNPEPERSPLSRHAQGAVNRPASPPPQVSLKDKYDSIAPPPINVDVGVLPAEISQNYKNAQQALSSPEIQALLSHEDFRIKNTAQSINSAARQALEVAQNFSDHRARGPSNANYLEALHQQSVSLANYTDALKSELTQIQNSNPGGGLTKESIKTLNLASQKTKMAAIDVESKAILSDLTLARNPPSSLLQAARELSAASDAQFKAAVAEPNGGTFARNLDTKMEEYNTRKKAFDSLQIAQQASISPPAQPDAAPSFAISPSSNSNVEQLLELVALIETPDAIAKLTSQETKDQNFKTRVNELLTNLSGGSGPSLIRPRIAEFQAALPQPGLLQEEGKLQRAIISLIEVIKGDLGHDILSPEAVLLRPSIDAQRDLAAISQDFTQNTNELPNEQFKQLYVELLTLEKKAAEGTSPQDLGGMVQNFQHRIQLANNQLNPSPRKPHERDQQSLARNLMKANFIVDGMPPQVANKIHQEIANSAQKFITSAGNELRDAPARISGLERKVVEAQNNKGDIRQAEGDVKVYKEQVQTLTRQLNIAKTTLAEANKAIEQNNQKIAAQSVPQVGDAIRQVQLRLQEVSEGITDANQELPSSLKAALVNNDKRTQLLLRTLQVEEKFAQAMKSANPADQQLARQSRRAALDKITSDRQETHSAIVQQSNLLQKRVSDSNANILRLDNLILEKNQRLEATSKELVPFLKSNTSPLNANKQNQLREILVRHNDNVEALAKAHENKASEVAVFLSAAQDANAYKDAQTQILVQEKKDFDTIKAGITDTDLLSNLAPHDNMLRDQLTALERSSMTPEVLLKSLAQQANNSHLTAQNVREKGQQTNVVLGSPLPSPVPPQPRGSAPIATPPVTENERAVEQLFREQHSPSPMKPHAPQEIANLQSKIRFNEAQLKDRENNIGDILNERANPNHSLNQAIAAEKAVRANLQQLESDRSTAQTAITNAQTKAATIQAQDQTGLSPAKKAALAASLEEQRRIIGSNQILMTDYEQKARDPEYVLGEKTRAVEREQNNYQSRLTTARTAVGRIETTLNKDRAELALMNAANAQVETNSKQIAARAVRDKLKNENLAIEVDPAKTAGEKTQVKEKLAAAQRLVAREEGNTRAAKEAVSQARVQHLRAEVAANTPPAPVSPEIIRARQEVSNAQVVERNAMRDLEQARTNALTPEIKAMKKVEGELQGAKAGLAEAQTRLQTAQQHHDDVNAQATATLQQKAEATTRLNNANAEVAAAQAKTAALEQDLTGAINTLKGKRQEIEAANAKVTQTENIHKLAEAKLKAAEGNRDHLEALAATPNMAKQQQAAQSLLDQKNQALETANTELAAVKALPGGQAELQKAEAKVALSQEEQQAAQELITQVLPQEATANAQQIQQHQQNAEAATQAVAAEEAAQQQAAQARTTRIDTTVNSLPRWLAMAKHYEGLAIKAAASLDGKESLQKVMSACLQMRTGLDELQRDPTHQGISPEVIREIRGILDAIIDKPEYTRQLRVRGGEVTEVGYLSKESTIITPAPGETLKDAIAGALNRLRIPSADSVGGTLESEGLKTNPFPSGSARLNVIECTAKGAFSESKFNFASVQKIENGHLTQELHCDKSNLRSLKPKNLLEIACIQVEEFTMANPDKSKAMLIKGDMDRKFGGMILAYCQAMEERGFIGYKCIYTGEKPITIRPEDKAKVEEFLSNDNDRQRLFQHTKLAELGRPVAAVQLMKEATRTRDEDMRPTPAAPHHP